MKRLSRLGIPARSVEADVEVDRADQNSLGLARGFDDPSWHAAFAGRKLPERRWV